MTTLTALEERVIALEDFVYEQLRLTMPAMNVGVTKIDAETVANRQAITDFANQHGVPGGHGARRHRRARRSGQ